MIGSSPSRGWTGGIMAIDTTSEITESDQETDSLQTYIATYRFRGAHEGRYPEARDRFEAELERLHEEGWAFDVRDTAVATNDAGQVTEATVRIAVQADGLIGWHAYRSRQPITCVRPVSD